ncbi:DNA independent RNA polymerase I transcription factor [Saccharomyces pastorianus]|uniref:DNA independent RNA polymerase I transcription factor n=1 Tax=Saccharomyces pastorianus TaxID=27292 RepID=A0A6C1EBV1_SACPS|nr:DNA independent RNA polymerase I transcription factor [Saccharomyces pastorianus]
MMAFENTSKRTPQEFVAPVDPKKRKVQFSNSTGLVTLQSEEMKDEVFSTAMYARFVKSALDDLDKNDSTQISIIANQVALPTKNSERIEDKNFNVLLDILSSNINRIESSRGTFLIQSIINFEKWWELPPQTLSKYIYFIKILCSSIPKWWQDVSMILVSCFVLPVEQTVCHHDMLKYFLRMIPSSMGFIDTYLAKFFPNKNDTQKKLVNYTSNLLKLRGYCSELGFQIWSLLIERTISIDVELQNELDELDDDELENAELVDDEDTEDEDLGDDDESDEDNDNEGAKSGITDINQSDDEDMDVIEGMDGAEEYNVELTQGIKELSTKLDAILTLVSSHVEEQVTPESLENGDGVGVFNTLTTLFKTHVLPTYYTRSIQYIMFHVSQQQLELMDSFLVTLIDISFAANEAAEKKIKSLQYLGSYIARAKKLSRTQIIFVASYLTSWLNRYVIEREEEVDQRGGMERFKHFYAAFQALCYIFCFRHGIFRDTDGNWECELDKFFQRMVISKFNPLKFCNENVMLMFARIAQQESVAYCFSIIENNNNERLRGIIGKADSDRKESSVQANTASSSWSLATRQQFIDLQSYFPFDPLFLKNYKILMKEYYIEWSEASGEYESDGSDD